MWSTLNNYTLGEPAWTELEVCLSGTPDHYYEIEAHDRDAEDACKARAEPRPPIAEALNREAATRGNRCGFFGARVAESEAGKGYWAAVAEIPAKPR